MTRQTTLTTQKPRAWASIRFSTEKQGINSIERQMDAIQRWADRFGVELIGVSLDLETSRTTEHDERPGLIEAIAQVHAQKLDILIAESVSRYAGDPGILYGIRKAVHPARLAVTDESGNAEVDEDMQDMAAIFSRHEIRAVRQRTKGALAMKRMRGERYACIPYGKRCKADGQHTIKKDGRRVCEDSCTGCLHLEDSPEEMRMIARAKELEAAGYGVRSIARQLNSEGFTARCGKPLVHVQVYKLLDKELPSDKNAA